MYIWQFDFIPFGFSKNYLPRETAMPCYLWLFQKIWRSFPSILAILVIFGSGGGGGGIDISLLQKKLLTSANNKWYQQLLSFILLEIGCLLIVFISVVDYFFFKNGEAGNSEWITWNCYSLISLKWIASLIDCSYGKSNI